MQILKKAKVNNYVKELNYFISNNEVKINDWIKSKQLQDIPIYSSVDIRDSGFKIAPVDTNLFPSGFNNLSEKSLDNAVMQFSKMFKRDFPKLKKIGIIVESFTRNINYWSHIKTLFKVLKETCLEVKLLTFDHELINIVGKLGIKIYKIRKEARILVEDKNWSPDLILLNNDLSEKVPDELTDIKTSILPGLKYGWHSRRKSYHCEAYNELVSQFSNEFNIDPWIISTYFKKCSNISFKKQQSLEYIAKTVDKLIMKIQEKYNEYKIKERPFVFIKANNGTFGRGIISVKNGEEVIDLNKKSRHNLNTIRNNIINSEVIVQEGIATIQEVDNYPAENVVYLVDGEVVGNFIRYNVRKGIDHNLNSKGMYFAPNTTSSPMEVFLSRIATIATTYEKINVL